MIIEELYLKANFLVNTLLQQPLQSKNVLKNEIIKRAINEGTYYITKEENVDKIIEESRIQTPEPFLSFGLKKPIFYSGLPDLAVSCLDLKLPRTITAVKLIIPYETLALFQIESNGLTYKLYYPNYLIESESLQKVYLGLTTEEGKFCYKEISENEKENYEVQIPLTEIKNIEKNLAKELKEKIKIIKKIKNQMRN